MERERVTAGALLAFGRDDPHLAEVRERAGKRGEPGGVDAVVVGDEEEGHGYSTPASRRLDSAFTFHWPFSRTIS